MLPLAKALEVLALTLPRFDSIDHVGTALALVYRSDIEMLPCSDLKTLRALTSDQVKQLVILVIHDLQEWGHGILVERGHGGRNSTFTAERAKIIQDAWDDLPDAPVWRAFARQLPQVQEKK